jgi:2-polyprenyl-3-methyl-5-hydroxy-6-metoxy-1,4-benzoquinol methylase
MAAYDYQPGFVIDSLTSHAYRMDLTAVLEELPVRARTLELGCGSGSFTQWLHTNQLDVTGVDHSEVQIVEARQRVTAVPFILCDIETDSGIDALARTHGLFDLLISRYVIHELTDPIETFSLWKKLLKPTG